MDKRKRRRVKLVSREKRKSKAVSQESTHESSSNIEDEAWMLNEFIALETQKKQFSSL